MANILPFDIPPQEDVRTTGDGLVTWFRQYSDGIEVGGQAPCPALSEEWIAGAYRLEPNAPSEARERMRDLLVVHLQVTLDFELAVKRWNRCAARTV